LSLRNGVSWLPLQHGQSVRDSLAQFATVANQVNGTFGLQEF
jgi:hypothetical protein